KVITGSCGITTRVAACVANWQTAWSSGQSAVTLTQSPTAGPCRRLRDPSGWFILLATDGGSASNRPAPCLPTRQTFVPRRPSKRSRGTIRCFRRSGSFGSQGRTAEAPLASRPHLKILDERYKVPASASYDSTCLCLLVCGGGSIGT